MARPIMCLSEVFWGSAHHGLIRTRQMPDQTELGRCMAVAVEGLLSFVIIRASLRVYLIFIITLQIII